MAEPILTALGAVGITHAFPIQALTLPIALDGHDVIGQARTGTGKTFAFGLPVLQRMVTTERGKPSAPRSLVVVPTRELAIQVAEDLRIAAAGSDVNVVTLYGGRAYEPQIEALATVDVVVGTPGRLLDLARQHQLDLSGVDVLVLDEADRMLDLGFLPDVESILKLTPATRQTMLFSATMPAEVVTLAKRHLYRPTHIRAEHHDEPAHVPTTDQHVFRAHQLDKIEVLARVLQAQGRGLTIVFCRTRRACDQVTATLTERGFAAAAVHGDLGQSQRERALRAFRSGKIDVLVATDVAARGLDVDDVTHVVNYECPEDEKAYLHRTGRTGRAGRTGVAVTFVDWQDMARWKLIDAALKLGQPEPLETYSTSPHLYSALAIPEGVTGALPAVQRERAGLHAEALEDIGETGKHRSRQGQRDSQGHGRKPRAGQSASGNTGQRGATQAKTRSGQEETTAVVKRSRRRTRGGAPIKAAAEPAAHIEAQEAATAPESVIAPDATRTSLPRRRRRPSRSATRGPGTGHGQDGQSSSTRPASRAEHRDIASD
ncbi:MAG TPA: DEAD/DEAH box helicase [Streptosporangiaceae bacterium]|nr:DEAD/DEAH box helicase [Streptosporangiaceae bacterium]